MKSRISATRTSRKFVERFAFAAARSPPVETTEKNAMNGTTASAFRRARKTNGMIVSP
jgi:hypothetical protein